MKYSQHKNKVSPQLYDCEWIKNTWGWDSPDNFIRSQGRNLRPRVQYALKMANLLPGMNVLDVGCGRGEVVLYCARKGIRALGVDYSKEAISIAQKAKATHNAEQQKRMKFICDDIEKVEFNDSFDRIFMLDLVEHLHDWELLKLFKVCDSMLKPNGILVIHTLPNKWLYEITYRRIIRLFMPWLPANPRTEKEMAIHINEMSITHLESVLRKAGFNSRIWLKELIVEQARWHHSKDGTDILGTAYTLLTHPAIGNIYKILALTPLRLLIVNEMFAVVWRKKIDTSINIPQGLTERFIIKFASVIRKNQRFRIDNRISLL